MTLRRPKLVIATAILTCLLAIGLAVQVAVSRLPRQPDYSPSEPVSGDVPLPVNISFSTSQAVVLPHENRNFADRVVAAHELSRSLSGGLVVVTDPPTDFKALVDTYRDALAQGQGKEVVVK